MFQKIAKHRANDASNDVHRPPLDANGKMSKVGAILLSACTARLARSAKRVVVEFRGSLISYWVGPYGVFFSVD